PLSSLPPRFSSLIGSPSRRLRAGGLGACITRGSSPAKSGRAGQICATSWLSGLARRLALIQNGVDQAVLHGLLTAHELVPVRILFNLFDRLARVTREYLVQSCLGGEHLAGMNVDVRR